MGPSRDVYNVARDTAYFIMKDIRPRSLGAVLRIGINMLFLNGYWIYKSVAAKDSGYLKGMTAFLSGVSDFLGHRKSGSTLSANDANGVPTNSLES
jgi:hypothetical protein